jgi:hypothetical protein
MAVVDDGDDEVLGLGDGDRRQAAEPHQLLAIAGDDQHLAIGLRLGETEADQRGGAHGAPEVIVGVRVAGGVDVVAGRAKPSHDEQIAAIPEQRRNDRAPIERSAELLSHRRHHFFAPIMRCEISTAIC